MQGNRPQQGISGIQTELKLSLKRHEMDARQLVQTFSIIGMSPNAENGLALRQKNFPAIKAAAAQLNKYMPDFLCGDDHVIGMMKQVEKAAVGVPFESLSNGNQVHNSLETNQQRGRTVENDANARQRILPRDGSNVDPSFQMARSNLMDVLNPTPIESIPQNGRGMSYFAVCGLNA